jgi:hypothetical protein
MTGAGRRAAHRYHRVGNEGVGVAPRKGSLCMHRTTENSAQFSEVTCRCRRAHLALRTALQLLTAHDDTRAPGE